MTDTEAVKWLENHKSPTITPQQLSDLIGGDPYTYNVMAKKGELRLPHILRGNRLLIFKAPILKILKGE